MPAGRLTTEAAGCGAALGQRDPGKQEAYRTKASQMIYAPQDQAFGLRRGVGAIVRIPEMPGVDFRGTVSRVASALQPGTRTLLTEIGLPNREVSYLQVGPGRDRVEAAERTLQVRSITRLDQGQEPGQPGDDPGAGSRVVMKRRQTVTPLLAPRDVRPKWREQAVSDGIWRRWPETVRLSVYRLPGRHRGVSILSEVIPIRIWIRLMSQ
jgi:hypothetical protein